MKNDEASFVYIPDPNDKKYGPKMGVPQTESDQHYVELYRADLRTRLEPFNPSNVDGTREGVTTYILFPVIRSELLNSERADIGAVRNSNIASSIYDCVEEELKKLCDKEVITHDFKSLRSEADPSKPSIYACCSSLFHILCCPLGSRYGYTAIQDEARNGKGDPIVTSGTTYGT